MNRTSPFISGLMLLSLSALPLQAADLIRPDDRLLLQTSLWTMHYDPEPDHNNTQELINIEWMGSSSFRFSWQEETSGWLRDVAWLGGAATFRNSFSQRSNYVYGGGRYDFHDNGRTHVYAKATAGLIHGYRGEHKNKIPLNRHGIAPVVLPAFGIDHGRLNLELIPFGAAGLMLSFGVYLR